MTLRVQKPGWQGYAVTLGLVALAGALTLLLRDFLASTPAILLIAATLVSAWYGGLWAGLLGSALTTLFVASYNGRRATDNRKRRRKAGEGEAKKRGRKAATDGGGGGSEEEEEL